MRGNGCVNGRGFESNIQNFLKEFDEMQITID